MKILRLDLTAYGPFTRRSMEFGEGGPNLHLVYGPNEAGKSTTLRAISGLFYGIEAQTSDAHRHAMPDLRIGATLQHSSGEVRAYVRKKGRAGTLLDAKGAVVDESTLRAWMSVPERRQFEQMFGLSHDQLRAAGAALADPKTDVGRLLFGATLDGTSLHHALLRLDEEAERLLSPRAGAITKSLGAYREQLAKAKDLAMPHRDWQGLQTEIERIEGEQRRVSGEIVRVRTERHRHERMQRALPWIRRRADALHEREALGEVRQLDEGVGGQRREVDGALVAAEERVRRAEVAVTELRAERDAMVTIPALLAAGPRVKTLTEMLGKYKGELRDQPGIQKDIIAQRAEQKEHLRRIGFEDIDARNVASIRVDDATLARVRSLQKDGVELQTRRREISEQIAVRRAALAQTESSLAELPPRLDVALLKATWEQLRPDRGLTAAIQNAEREVMSLDEQAASEGASLAPWQGPLDEAPRLQVPSDEAHARFVEAFATAQREAHDLRERMTSQSAEREGFRRERLALEVHGDPPSPSRLAAARADRDRRWERLRATLRDGDRAALFDDGAGTAVADFVIAMRLADECADDLRRESARGVQHALLCQREDEAEQAIRRTRDALQACEAEQGRLNEAWSQAWRASGILPASPVEMSAWRGRHARLVTTLRELDGAMRRLEVLRRQQREQHVALVAALGAAGVEVSEGVSWLALLLLVERTLAQATSGDTFRASLAQKQQSYREELASYEARLGACEAELDAWRVQWGSAVAPLRLASDARTEQADVVIAGLGELARIEANCEKQEARLKAITKQTNSFVEHLDALQAELALDLHGTPVERADALIARHHDATSTDARRRTLDEQLRKLEHTLAEALLAVEHERRRLDALLTHTGCADLVALDEALQCSSRAARLDAQIREAEVRLAEVGEGWAVDALEADARATDSDRLESEIAAQDEVLKSLELEQHQHAESLGRLRERQSKFSGQNEAALALSEAQGHLAQARTLADRYARVRLATAVLRRGIERYRQRSQGTILRRASRLMECLTLGRYPQLTVEYDGERARLVCVRGGEPVDVKGALSDGTLDQLYLALRLASLEEHLESQEPMPLVLDDIFIHFDDDRARAGLQVIAELSAKTQVILLTHHARNLELAREALLPAVWREHRLPSPIGGV